MTDTQRARELLPCPWCGSPGEYRATRHGAWVVECSNTAEGDGCLAEPHTFGATDEEAARRWNTRATLPGREGIEAAAKIADAEADLASKQVERYNSYVGPELPARSIEAGRCAAARHIAAAIRALNSGAGR